MCPPGIFFGLSSHPARDIAARCCQEIPLKLPLNHLAGGQSHPAGKNRSLVWMADFRSRADFEASGNLGEPGEMALEADGR